MSIDADLSSGLISEREALERRQELEAKTDFYGAMDGASKFVRGDAIAGIIITIVNIIGGLLVGVLQQGLTVAEAAKFYTMLTIGDGLVSQIPALIISTAAGTVVTRNSAAKNIGKDIVSQLFFSFKVVAIVSGFLLIFAMIPGVPALPFISTSFLMGCAAYYIYTSDNKKERS